MGLDFIGKIFALKPATVASSGGIHTPAVRSVNPSFKSAGYASIPYERAPKHGDTVPTVDKNGNPLLPGYCPEGRVFDSNVWLGV